MTDNLVSEFVHFLRTETEVSVEEQYDRILLNPCKEDGVVDIAKDKLEHFLERITKPMFVIEE